MRPPVLILIATVVALARGAAAAEVWLSDLDLTLVRQSWSTALKDRSVIKNPLKMAGKTYKRGVGTHANGEMHLDLQGRAQRFIAAAGLDDDSRDARGEHIPGVRFAVIGDGRVLWQSPVMIVGREPRPVDLDVTGIRFLSLVVVTTVDSIHYAHANWADAKIVAPEEARLVALRDAPKENEAAVRAFFAAARQGRPPAPR